MAQREIEAEARLQAIEYLLRYLLTAQLAGATDPLAAVTSMREAIKRQFAKETFPGADPALSDHISAKIEKAVDVQLAAVSQTLAGFASRSREPD